MAEAKKVAVKSVKPAAKKVAVKSVKPAAKKVVSKAPAKAVAAKVAAKAPAKVAVKKSSAKKSEPSYQEIAALAHQYWVERGHHHGSDAQDWLRAEKELLGK